MPHDVWNVIHELMAHFESDFPTKHRLRGLIAELSQERHADQVKKLQEVEYLCLSLSELLSLARDDSIQRR